MSCRMFEIMQGTNMLRGRFYFHDTSRCSSNYLQEQHSQIYSIGPINLQFKVLFLQINQNCDYLMFLKCSRNVNADDGHLYTITFLSQAMMGIMNLTCEDTWRLIKNSYFYNVLEFDFSVHLKIGPQANTFAQLHEDTELSDFELSGDDGAVKVHKAVLAVTSPVFRTMLSGDWRETGEGRVQVPGTTRDTLQQLKDYIYLRTVPETGLEQLLLLAGYYMMTDLESLCIDKLTESFTANNAKDLLDFAFQHNKKLLVAIFKTLDVVKIKELEEYFKEQ